MINVQISVVIWTVICFCLLMVILENLLFKPVLKVLDARRNKISMAKRRHEEAELEREEILRHRREEQTALRENNAKMSAVMIDKARHDATLAVEEHFEILKADDEKFNKEQMCEETKMLAKIVEEVPDLATGFVNGFVSWSC